MSTWLSKRLFYKVVPFFVSRGARVPAALLRMRYDTVTVLQAQLHAKQWALIIIMFERCRACVLNNRSCV